MLPTPGYEVREPLVHMPPFRSTLGNEADIVSGDIGRAVRAVMNGVREVDSAIARLEGQPVTAADLLLERVAASIDVVALENAKKGLQLLERQLGAEGTVVFEACDYSVASLREQVELAVAKAEPYIALSRRKP